MSFTIIPLIDLIDKYSEDFVKRILSTFRSKPEKNDVETFLIKNAIQFEKMTTSTTYLVFNTATVDLVGYFSLANKSLTIPKKNYDKLSSSLKRSLSKSGSRTHSGEYVVNSYLIGQLGKNYAVKQQIQGKDLLTMAYQKVQEAKKIIRSKYVWLECSNHEKLIDFYESFGFSQIKGYSSANGLLVLIMKIK